MITITIPIIPSLFAILFFIIPLFSVPRDQLSTFIREPQAIERNIGKVKTQLEVW